MLEMIEVFVLQHSGEEKFFHMIGRTYPKGSRGYALIRDSYKLAGELFADVTRDSGHLYFEHLEATAIISNYEQNRIGLHDADVIAGSLLHDVIEMKPRWTKNKLAKLFNPRVAELVQTVSKEPLANFANDKHRRDEAYKKQLRRLGKDSMLIKLPDQTHNLITLWAKSPEDQRKKIALAWELYSPLARQHDVLVFPLHAAIMTAQARSFVASFFRPHFTFLHK